MKPNAAQIFLGGIKSTLDTLWRTRLNGKEPIVLPDHFWTTSDQSYVIKHSSQLINAVPFFF